MGTTNFFCGKAISVKYFECVCIRPLFNWHVSRIFSVQHYTVVCVLSSSTLHFLHYLIHSTSSSEKVVEHKMCFFVFLCEVSFPGTFLILGRIQRNVLINIQRSSYNVLVILVRDF